MVIDNTESESHYVSVRPWQQIEEFYRQRLDDCRSEYLRAKASLEAVSRDVDMGLIPTPDGPQAYRNAVVAERVAHAAFMKALLEFNRVLLDRRLP